jgi:flagellar protein FlaG
MLIQSTNGIAATTGVIGASDPVVAANLPHAAPEMPQVAISAATGQPPTPEQLKTAVDSINSAVQKSNPDVEFSIDQSTKQTVIKVMDSQTGQLITQFPSKEALAVSQMIGQSRSGALVKQQA